MNNVKLICELFVDIKYQQLINNFFNNIYIVVTMHDGKVFSIKENY
ncbi:hypothetical protein [Wolbachia endosymbiont (group A) of Brachyopa scutellaris]